MVCRVALTLDFCCLQNHVHVVRMLGISTLHPLLLICELLPLGASNELTFFLLLLLLMEVFWFTVVSPIPFSRLA